MVLGDYLKERRKLAFLRAILILIVIAIAWAAYLKVILLSGETRLRNAEEALAKDKWEEADLQYRGARDRFQLYLKIFKTLPEKLSIEKTSHVKKQSQIADNGVKKVIAHYREIERRNRESKQREDEFKRNYRERLLTGKTSPTEDEYIYTPDEVEIPEISKSVTSKSTEPGTLNEEEGKGRWMEDIENFEEDGVNAHTDVTPTKLDVKKDEGVVESSKPAWFNKNK